MKITSLRTIWISISITLYEVTHCISVYLYAKCLFRVFHGGSGGKETACNAGDPRFNPWVRKMPWRREWLPTAVFLPKEFHGQRNLVGYSLWGCKESDMTDQLTHTHRDTHNVSVYFGYRQDAQPSTAIQLFFCALSNIKHYILEMLVIQIGIEGRSLGCCSSVAVLSDTLRSHGLQHTRLPCPSLSPGVCPNSSPLSWWCHPTISSSVDPLFALNLSQHQCLLQWVSSLHQALKYQSFILSISPSNEYSGLIFFRIHGLISLMLKGFSKVFSSTTVWKHQFFDTQPS